MARSQAPSPINQEELSQEQITPYTINGKPPSENKKERALQRRVDDTTFKPINIGLKDIDEAIFYYFNEVIKLSVIQNGNRINVPIVYGNPERWASVQSDGFYRDKNGKIQTPLLMFKRDSIEKNRSLGSKVDSNSPVNYGVFEKGYTKKNIYDNFSILTNREPIKEYYGVVFPDYVNIVYSCILFTDYVEQMNKLIESINYASDSYWGDPQRFKFRSMIDSYQTVVELTKGSDRAVKTTFNINLLGHIVPDTINASLIGSNRFFSKSKINFKLETVDTVGNLMLRANTPEKQASRRFFDTGLTGAQVSATLNTDQIIFITTSNSAEADTVTTNEATFNNKSFLTPPPGFTIGQDSFVVYVNGIAITTSHRTVAEAGSNITVTFNEGLVGYPIESSDTVILTGKFS